MSDKKILKGIRTDLKFIKPRDIGEYHKQERYLSQRAAVIHNRALKLHPADCDCPYHGGHKRAKCPMMRGIGRKGI